MVTVQWHSPVWCAAVVDVARVPALTVRETDQAGPPKPRLLDRVREAIRTRHYSRRTEKASVAWIRRYIFFHGARHPADRGAAEITAFLASLAVDGRVAASTQNQALSALLFLYREVFEREVPWLDDLVDAKRPHHLPDVLTREEVRAILAEIHGVPRLMAILLYDHDLHPRSEPGPGRGPEPGGPDLRRMIPFPPGWRRPTSERTRQFRRARPASPPWREPSSGNLTPTPPVDAEPCGATTRQRALRHRCSTVPPNSRSAHQRPPIVLVARIVYPQPAASGQLGGGDDRKHG